MIHYVLKCRETRLFFQVSCVFSLLDDWSRERSSTIYFMGEMVNIEASVDHDHHPPLRLYVGDCVATLTPDVDSDPRYPFIDHQG